MLRKWWAGLAGGLVALVAAQPALASKVFTVTGTFSDGGSLSGTFTTSDDLLTLQSTALTVAGGNAGFDAVIFNQQSYIASGSNNLPNGFFLNAPSSVNKSLTLAFAAPLSLASGATLTNASTNFQQGVGTRSVVVGFVAGPEAPGGVPEPATWAMMLAGFGAIGAVLRRRHLASEAAFTAKVRAIAESGEA